MSTQVDNPRILTGTITPMTVEPVTLEGQYVRLEPLSLDHHVALSAVLLDDDLWRWMPRQVLTPDAMNEFIRMALKWRGEGSALPFATIYKSTNEVVGMSRYLTIERDHHTIEIGGTLVGKNWQRTVVNTEAKYLMLCHAFETLGCIRVQFQTDSLNTKSRNAILRLGATQEGIFRNKIICWVGRIRHSVYFSNTDEVWLSNVKANLEAKLARSSTPQT
jgi:RimJ/RimL family protein N-acetyltransferase